MTLDYWLKLYQRLLTIQHRKNSGLWTFHNSSPSLFALFSLFLIFFNCQTSRVHTGHPHYKINMVHGKNTSDLCRVQLFYRHQIINKTTAFKIVPHINQKCCFVFFWRNMSWLFSRRLVYGVVFSFRVKVLFVEQRPMWTCDFANW